MNQILLKLSLYLNFLVCAILLNSVGIVILQSINHYHVSPVSASTLEACKDLSIAVVSFSVAAFLPKFGYKRAMLVGLALLVLACSAMASFNQFAVAKLLFVAIGISFALIKLSVYSSVGLITHSSDEHASLLSSLEGVFQLGVVSGYWLFSYFTATSNWCNVYWILAILALLALLLLSLTHADDSKQSLPNHIPSLADFMTMLSLLRLPLVWLFVISIFMYVFIEQGVQSWLPTFNNQVLAAPATISIELSSLFALSIAVGRLGGSWLMRYLSWARVIALGLILSLGLIAISWPLTQHLLPHAIGNWSQLPIVAYVFPLVGLCLAPIYPSLCSSVLSKLPPSVHSAMTGLIVIFSALGGTFGSRLISLLFAHLGGKLAFYATLIPIVLLLLIIFPYHKLQLHFKSVHLKSES